MSATEIVVALTTVADMAMAEGLAQSLLQGRWAACVTVLPGAQSWYWWEGAVAHTSECVLLIKSTRERWPALRQALLERHPYDTPELLMWSAQDVPAPYAAWLRAVIGERVEGPSGSPA